MLKNIIFDWSGVVCDNTKNVYLAAMAILKKFGVKKIGFQTFKKEFKTPFMLFYNKYIPNLTLKEEKELYAKEYAKLKKPLPHKDINKIIRDLKENGIRMAVISSDPPRQLKNEITRFKLKNIFITIKPEVHNKNKALKSVIKKNNFKLKETVFIADTAHELKIGNKIGIKTAAVNWGINDLNELIKVKPTYLIKHPLQIKKIIHDS